MFYIFDFIVIYKSQIHDTRIGIKYYNGMVQWIIMDFYIIPIIMLLT